MHSEILDIVRHLEALTLELNSVRNDVVPLERAGLSIAKMESLRHASRALLQDEIDVLSVAQVGSVAASLGEHISENENIRSECSNVLNELTETSRSILATEGIGPQNDLSPTIASTLITRLRSKEEQAHQAILEVENLLKLDGDTPIESLQSALQGCLLSYEKASNALMAEASSSSIVKSKEAELRTHTQRLSLALEAQEHLSRAANVLTSVVDQFSLDKATGESFSSIRANVGDVFARIHSPQEYSLGSFSDGQVIVQRGSEMPHDVNQISTGQRAALALSIFLALNNSASSAPPVILIDDPVAHIDDLNALSFLDYLRDLAVEKGKQIFFATADVRLAALFQRKFDFLGTENFRRIELTQ